MKKPINVMVNGIPGKMAIKVTEHVIKTSDLELMKHSLTGPEITDDGYMMNTGVGPAIKIITLITPDEREEQIGYLKYQEPICVDYTHPDGVNGNADFYCRHNIPFVMGTTGGDRKALEERVKNSNNVAVIAPNMAKQVVAFQEVISNFAATHIQKLKDCSLYIRESHQGADIAKKFRGKADTSGTADAVRKDFNSMGIPYAKEDVAKIRMKEDQIKLGVPIEYLNAHGWHTYWIYGFEDNETLDDLAGTVRQFILKNEVFSGYEISDNIRGFSGEDPASYPEFAGARSKDGTVFFAAEMHPSRRSLKFTHNVNGRDIYAAGTIDAIRFLDKKVKAGEKGQVYSMMDVLKG